MSAPSRVITVAYMVEVIDDGLAVAAFSDDLPGYNAFGNSIDECRQLVEEYLRDEEPGTTIGREVLLDENEQPVSVVSAVWIDGQRIDPYAVTPPAIDDPRVLSLS